MNSKLDSATKELPIHEFTLSRVNPGLGFNIRGGTDTKHLEEDSGIFVSQIKDTGSAFLDGRLKVGDKIITVDTIDVQMLTHQQAVDVLKDCGDMVTLRIQPGAYAYIMKKRAAKDMNTVLWYVALGVGVILLLGSVGGFIMSTRSSKV